MKSNWLFVGWLVRIIQTEVATPKSFKPFKKPMPRWAMNKNVPNTTIPDHNLGGSQDFMAHRVVSTSMIFLDKCLDMDLHSKLDAVM